MYIIFMKYFLMGSKQNNQKNLLVLVELIKKCQ